MLCHSCRAFLCTVMLGMVAVNHGGGSGHTNPIKTQEVSYTASCLQHIKETCWPPQVPHQQQVQTASAQCLPVTLTKVAAMRSEVRHPAHLSLCLLVSLPCPTGFTPTGLYCQAHVPPA